ncbi:MAG TPA: SDR family oxidoreductase, partial [Pyrodictium sp.]|nr:SDR family oxidoreductase [Pyrodictium sp.]
PTYEERKKADLDIVIAGSEDAIVMVEGGRKEVPEEVLSEIAQAIPLARLGEPREVGYLVAFLLSPYASYITGASIPIDGGLLRSVF